MSDEAKKVSKKFVSIKTYAGLCGISPGAVYQRIYRTQDGEYESGHPCFLEMTSLSEVDGDFIDVEKYPPRAIKPQIKKFNK